MNSHHQTGPLLSVQSAVSSKGKGASELSKAFLTSVLSSHSGLGFLFSVQSALGKGKYRGTLSGSIQCWKRFSAVENSHRFCLIL